MKRLVIIISVLTGTSLGLLAASAQTTGRITDRITEPNEPNVQTSIEEDMGRSTRRTVERRDIEAEGNGYS